MKHIGLTAMLVAVLTLAACNSAEPSTIDFLNQGSAQACSAKDVRETLERIISPDVAAIARSRPDIASDLADVAKQMVYRFSLITLEGVNREISEVSCDARVEILSDDVGTFHTTEPISLSYTVQPSAENKDEFVVSVDDSDVAQTAMQVLLAAAEDRAEKGAKVATPITGPASDRFGVEASFACGEASNDIERAICADDELKAADRAVAIAFKRVSSVGDPEEWLASQRSWLAGERNRCSDASCIRDAYFGRLGTIAAEAEGAIPHFVRNESGQGGTLSVIDVAPGIHAFAISAYWAGEGEGNVNTGELAGIIRVADGEGEYRDEGCHLVFQQRNGGWSISQPDGLCGMGMNVTAAGTYARP